MTSGSLTIESIIGELDFDPVTLRQRYDFERDRRLRPDGKAQYLEATADFSNFSRDPWVEPGFTRAPITDHTTVIVAGGGFGGLLAGARLREAGFADVRIIEEAGDFGGTWYWNRYPGAMCDIEAHIYLPLLEELQYKPKNRYSFAPEMLEHCRNIAKHYDLYDKACFQTAITEAVWDELQNRWTVSTDRDDCLTADYLILACGRQSLPKLPGIPGINELEAHTFHSSRWDYGYTGGDPSGGLTGLEGKRVGIIGTGASAVQIVPEVAKWAEQLIVFQRTPSAVGVRANCDTGPDWVDYSQPGWQKKRRENFQALVTHIRQELNYVNDGWTDIHASLNPLTSAEITELLGRPATKEELAYFAEVSDYRVMNEIRARIDEVVKDPTTADALKPWYRWACKRPCFHDEYLDSFNQDNVLLVDTHGLGVERFTKHGVVVAGKEYELDCLIFATGFEAGITYTHLTGFDITGRDGTKLSEHWGAGVRTLHGMSTDKFPNCFFMGGNQQTAAAVNAVHLLDEQAGHIAYILKETRKRSASVVEPLPGAIDAYVNVIRTSSKNMAALAFYEQCTPGYFNLEGKAKRSEELFGGGRFGDGPLAFYQVLEDWRNTGNLDGLTFGDEREADHPTLGLIADGWKWEPASEASDAATE